jgi:hypothetical protein
MRKRWKIFFLSIWEEAISILFSLFFVTRKKKSLNMEERGGEVTLLFVNYLSCVTERGCAGEESSSS